MSFVGGKAAHADTSVTSYTLDPTGTGYIPGDLLILAVGINNTGAQTATPSGTWTNRGTMTQSSGTVDVYTKTAVASEPIITITHNSSSRGASMFMVRRGESWSGSITFTPDANNSSTPVAPSGTLPAGSVLIEIPWMRSSTWTATDVWNSSYAGVTKRVDSISVGNGGIALSFWDRTTSGAYSAATYTTAPTSVTTQTGGVGVFVTTTAVRSGTFTDSNGGAFSITGKKGAKVNIGVAMRTGNSASMGITGVKAGSGGGGAVVASTNFDTGSGSIPTNGTDFYNSGNAIGTGSALYATNWSHSGGQSMRLQTPVSTDQANRSKTFTAQNIYVFRGYLHMTALPSNAAQILSSVNSSLITVTAVAQLRLSTAGVLQMRDQTTAVGGTVALSAGVDYRIEWKVDPGGGTQTLRVWNPGNVDGSIANFDTQIATTCTNAGAASIDSMSTSAFGTAIVDLNWDDIAIGNVDWIGPTTQAASSTITLSGGGDFTLTGTRVRQVNVILSGGDQESISGSKNDADNASGGFFTGTDVTVAKDAQSNVVLSGGGDFSISHFVTFNEVHFGQFLLSGGGDYSATPNKGAKVAMPPLTGGTTSPAFTVKKGAKNATLVLSGGFTLAPSWTVSHSELNQGTVVLSGGGAFSITGRKGARPTFVLSGGGDFLASIRKNAQRVVLLRTGSSGTEVWTATVVIGPGLARTGTFVLSGGGGFQASTATPSSLVQLVWNVSVDDHPRPQYHPLWKRFRYPHTRYGLLLWRDGRVLETSNLERPEELDADFVISGGWYGFETDWQAQVLLDAGYTLVRIDSVSELVTAGV